jgi:hypothetical protein
MVYFQTKNPKLGQILSVFQVKRYCQILGPFYGHLVYYVVILVHFSSFGMLYQEKSGNPAARRRT